jgi:hypothetical protein
MHPRLQGANGKLLPATYKHMYLSTCVLMYVTCTHEQGPGHWNPVSETPHLQGSSMTGAIEFQEAEGP